MTNTKMTPGNGDTGDERGACWVPDPVNGQLTCHYVTQSQCNAMGGTFDGGPCPPTVAEAKAIVKPPAATTKQSKKTPAAPKKKKSK